MTSMAPATLSLASAASSWPWTRERNRRAIQYSAESPSTAPKAPATITHPRSRYPCAASVDAVFSVVSPGSTAMTASPKTSANTATYGQGPSAPSGSGCQSNGASATTTASRATSNARAIPAHSQARRLRRSVMVVRQEPPPPRGQR